MRRYLETLTAEIALSWAFARRASMGVKITHVPYRGSGPAMQDVMGGQVPTMMLDLASGLPIIKAGKVRVLAIALPQRAGALPEVPTFVEAGFSDVNAYAFHGLIGPAGMPPEAVARINSELQKAMKAPKVVKLAFLRGILSSPVPLWLDEQMVLLNVRDRALSDRVVDGRAALRADPSPTSVVILGQAKRDPRIFLEAGGLTSFAGRA